MSRLKEADKLKNSYSSIQMSEQKINDQNKDMLKKAVIENGDKTVETFGVENCKTLGQYKSAKEMAEKNRKLLQERNRALKKKMAKFVATGALIVMLALGTRAIIRNRQNNEQDYTGKNPVYSEKLPENQENEITGEAELETEAVNKGGSYKPAESPHDISAKSTLNEKGVEYTETKTTTGTTKNEVSIQSEDSKKEIEKQEKEIEQRKKEEDTVVKEHKDKITTVKEEKKEEIKKNEEKNKIDHSYGEAEEEKGQVVEKIESEESKKAANKITDQVKEVTPAPEEAPEKTDTYKEATDAELDALEELFR